MRKEKAIKVNQISAGDLSIKYMKGPISQKIVIKKSNLFIFFKLDKLFLKPNSKFNSGMEICLSNLKFLPN